MIETKEWTKVHAALADPKWDFRTVGGIARETGLDPEREIVADIQRFVAKSF